MKHAEIRVPNINEIMSPGSSEQFSIECDRIAKKKLEKIALEPKEYQMSKYFTHGKGMENNLSEAGLHRELDDMKQHLMHRLKRQAQKAQ